MNCSKVFMCHMNVFELEWMPPDTISILILKMRNPYIRANIQTVNMLN